MFDNRNGVKAYIKKLKGILMWKFWMLQHVGIISSNAYSCFLMALHDVPLPTQAYDRQRILRSVVTRWILHTINIIVCFYQKKKRKKERYHTHVVCTHTQASHCTRIGLYIVDVVFTFTRSRDHKYKYSKPSFSTPFYVQRNTVWKSVQGNTFI